MPEILHRIPLQFLIVRHFPILPICPLRSFVSHAGSGQSAEIGKVCYALLYSNTKYDIREICDLFIF